MSIKMEKRRLAIVRYVESHGSCRLETLAQQLNVSVQTIRSDIRFLNESGRVFRTHGGIGAYQRENIGYSSRERQHLVQKEAIGKEAAKLLNGVNSCALGTGSTVEMLAKALQREDPLHVCTNNFHTLIHLCDKPPIVLTVAGGRVRKRDQDVIGGDALLFFKRYRTEIGIVSVGAMSKAGELYDYNDDEVMARQALVGSVKKTVLLVDSSKIGKIAMCQNGSIVDFDYIISDSPPPQECINLLETSETEWVTANA